MSESRRREALQQLARAEGIDEVVVLPTPNRSDFILWTHDAGAASASVLGFLTREYGLRLGDWGHFYRKLDHAALVHVFGAASGLEPMVSEPELAAQLKSAWALAQQTGASGPCLNALMQRALTLLDRLAGTAAEQAQAIVAEEAKRFQAEVLTQRPRSLVAGSGR